MLHACASSNTPISAAQGGGGSAAGGSAASAGCFAASSASVAAKGASAGSASACALGGHGTAPAARGAGGALCTISSGAAPCPPAEGTNRCSGQKASAACTPKVPRSAKHSCGVGIEPSGSSPAGCRRITRQHDVSVARKIAHTGKRAGRPQYPFRGHARKYVSLSFDLRTLGPYADGGPAGRQSRSGARVTQSGSNGGSESAANSACKQRVRQTGQTSVRRGAVPACACPAPKTHQRLRQRRHPWRRNARAHAHAARAPPARCPPARAARAWAVAAAGPPWA